MIQKWSKICPQTYRKIDQCETPEWSPESSKISISAYGQIWPEPSWKLLVPRRPRNCSRVVQNGPKIAQQGSQDSLIMASWAKMVQDSSRIAPKKPPNRSRYALPPLCLCFALAVPSLCFCFAFASLLPLRSKWGGSLRPMLFVSAFALRS